MVTQTDSKDSAEIPEIIAEKDSSGQPQCEEPTNERHVKPQSQPETQREKTSRGNLWKKARSAVDKHKQEALTSDGQTKRMVNCTIINPNRLKHAKVLVEKAIKEKKIFSIKGPYPVIRSCLRSRGWVEKKFPNIPKVLWKKEKVSDDDTEDDDGDGSDNDNDEDDEEDKENDPDSIYNLLSRLVRNETTYFFWTTRCDAVDSRILRKDQMVNHFVNAGSFTTKVGLCVNLRNLLWFDETDPDTFFPRCYKLGAKDDTRAFIEDFWLTAAQSILKQVVKKSSRPTSVQNTNAREGNNNFGDWVPAQIILTALQACESFLSRLEHNDIDLDTAPAPPITDALWEVFLQGYYRVIHEGATIEQSDIYLYKCQDVLEKLRAVTPQLEIEGDRNIWIIKPGAKSRGRDIICMDRLEEILKLVSCGPGLIREGKWVVQKYIERPLLIYGTKFDVRQWFLVTDWNPLTIWFFRRCYIRFATQPFSLENLHKSIHLCNNSIQKHFENSQQRDSKVPADNMWSDDQFQKHLQELGSGHAWSRVIVPGMKAAIIHSMQSAQDVMMCRKNSFELYGADFMFGEDFHPWLIEINASPTMAPSTLVTANLCAKVQEDTIRVVIDRKHDSGCDVGDFELIYKQAAVEVPQYFGINLMVEGLPVKKPRPPANRLSNGAINIGGHHHLHLRTKSTVCSKASETETKPLKENSAKHAVTSTVRPMSTVKMMDNPQPMKRAKTTVAGKENKASGEVYKSVSESVAFVGLHEKLGPIHKDYQTFGHVMNMARGERLLPLRQQVITVSKLNLSEKSLIVKKPLVLRDGRRHHIKHTSLDSEDFQTLRKVTRLGFIDSHIMPNLLCKGSNTLRLANIPSSNDSKNNLRNSYQYHPNTQKNSRTKSSKKAGITITPLKG